MDAPYVPDDVCTYASGLIEERLHKMLAQVDGVLAQSGVEPVHQMRVWSRRTRAALEIFAARFPGKEFVALEREVKAAADALGEARDLDVMIETLSQRAEELPHAQRPGLESFVLELQATRASRQLAVTKAIKRLERQDLAPRFARLSAEHSPNSVLHGASHIERKRDAHG